jgi:hypothetical protein
LHHASDHQGNLTFAVTLENEVIDVLDGLAEVLAVEFGAVRLFDLPFDGVVYRVLLLRGALQVDLSVAPAVKFGARGPQFRLVFGDIPSFSSLFACLRRWTRRMGEGCHHRRPGLLPAVPAELGLSSDGGFSLKLSRPVVP